MQQASFRVHIRAARLADVPLVIHARDADEDIARILREEREADGPFDFLMHCFSSGRALAEAAHRHGRLRELLGHPDLPALDCAARDRPRRPGRQAARRNRCALSRARTVPWQTQRAGLDRAHRAGARRSARAVAREGGGADDRELPPPVPQSGGLIRMRVIHARLRRLGRRAADRRRGRDRRVGPVRPGRAAQPPHPVEHRRRGRRTGAGCWSIRGRICASNCWRAASALSMPSCSRTPMPTTSPASTTCAFLTAISARRFPRSGRRRTLGEIRQRFDYAFKPWQPPGFFRPVLMPQLITPGDRIEAAGLSVFVIHQDHGFLDTLGLRIGAFGYSTDVVRMDEAAFAALRGIEIWIVGCFTRGKPHPTHANLDQVLQWSQRVGARRTILTHMGHDMDWAWLKANLPESVEPGWDGMEFEVGG